MNYKAYQQVLNLAGENKRTKTKPKSEAAPKKRTKTGCMTCRGRKKKCDEEKVGGKCQACIRNFLDCCWPEDHMEEAKVELKTPVLRPSKGASAYPSPISSPKAEAVDECKDIKCLDLPAAKFKISKPKAAKKERIPKASAQFIVTSFDYDKALCQIHA